MAPQPDRSAVRVGVVGTGFAASSHLDALSRVRGVRVTGFVGSSPDRAQAAAERLGLDPDVIVAELAALLEGDEVDAIHNCTPNHLHAEVTLAALAAGKHVLSEKPLGMDAAETDQLAAAARDSDVVSGVCFTYRHFPLVQQARWALAEGVEGAVHFVHGSYLQDWLLREDDWNWRLESAKAGATRAMGDIGSHWVDTVEHVTGDRIGEVTADLGRLHQERLRPAGEVETFTRTGSGGIPYRVDTEDYGSVLFRFDSGARGTFAVSQVSAGRRNRLWFQIDAARASFAWDQEEPNRLWIGRRDGANAELPRDPSLLGPPAAPLAHYPGGHQEGWPDALRNLFADFYRAVAAHRRGDRIERTVASFPEAHHVTQVIEAIAASHHAGSWVRVGQAEAASRATRAREVTT